MKKTLRSCSLVLLIAGMLLASQAFGEVLPRVDTPTITCDGSTQNSINIKVCAGAVTGAPSGFSLHWKTLAGFEQNGWPNQEGSPLCKAWFWDNLAPGECTTVTVGEALTDRCPLTTCKGQLACDTEYVFRAFAHATKTSLRSYATPNLTCGTLPCGNGNACTLTQGYWKTHNPTVCSSSADSPLCINWPASSLTLGASSYTVSQLVGILDTPAAGNGLIQLAHQLIGAKLNIANGADGSVIADDIASADALIGSFVVPPVGTGYLAPSETGALIDALTKYNEGASGPGSCD
ncbi:MAG: hypothetical protein U0411_01780 [Thermodesulfovibrionales bacterium]